MGKGISLLSYYLLFAILSAFFLGPSLNGMNDDSIIVWLTSGYDGTTPTAITNYTSLFYGYILKTLYGLNLKIGWHGLIQISLVIFGSTIFTYLLLEIQKKVTKSQVALLIAIQTIFIIWFTPRPTFTITAIYIAFISFSILLLIIENNLSKKFFIASTFLIAFSYLLRPDAAFLASGFSLLNLFIYFVIFRKPTKRIAFQITAPALLIISFWSIDQIAEKYIMQQSNAWAYFFEFDSLNYKLDTNPAELMFYKKIDDGELSELDWSSVESVLYQKNVFFDKRVFSNDLLGVAVASVSDQLGIMGALNYGIEKTAKRSWMFLEESRIILVFFLFTLTFVLTLRISWKQKALLVVPSLLLILLIFYYLSAVSRLPLRVHMPLLLGLSILLFTIFFQFEIINKKIALLITLSSLSLLSYSLLFSQTGIFKIHETNELNRAKILKSIEIMNRLDSSGRYIGTLEAFSLNAMLAYGNPATINDINYLTSGWMAFSPPWHEKKQSMNFLKNNPYEAIAKQPGVYWVSDPVSAEVVNMYMNNREILRRNKCEIAQLHDGIRIYTFQSEIKCEN